jgi:HEPN domain-containing protein
MAHERNLNVLKKSLTLFVLFGVSHGLFAVGTEYPPPSPSTMPVTATTASAPGTTSATVSPVSATATGQNAQNNSAMRTNKYITQSKQLTVYAKRAFATGDYDASIRYADDATKAARLSDQYAALYLKIYETNSKIAHARNRLDWADTVGAQKYFTKEFFDAKAFYNTAIIAQNSQKWDEAMDNANNAIQILAKVVAPPTQSSTPAQTEQKTAAVTETNRSGNPDVINKNAPLPSQYIVRPWDAFGDCFWNIAAKPWAYGNPYRWPILYSANKSKLPDPNNPNVIEPGMIMDIPSVNGEKREGMWDSGVPYNPVKKN